MKYLRTMMAVAAFALAIGNVAQAIEKDFNGDGYSDLVWENTVTGQRGYWFMQNQNITSFGWTRYPNMQQVTPPPPNWHIVGISDFPDDGSADLVWQDSISGAAQIWYQKNLVLSSIRPMSIPPWPIVAVSQTQAPGYAHYVDITMVAPDQTIWVQYYADGDTNGSLYQVSTPPGSGPDSPIITGGKLGPGWRIAGEVVNNGPDYGGDQNGVVMENMVDGRIAFAKLVVLPDANPSAWQEAYSSYTISSVRIGAGSGWHIAGSGKFSAPATTRLHFLRLGRLYQAGLGKFNYGSTRNLGFQRRLSIVGSRLLATDSTT
jgi:hypothetical protein